MENQINVGIQRQSYEAFEAIDSEAENSDANASLTDDSAGANKGGNPNSVSPHLEGESIHAAPPETAAATNTLNRYGVGDVVIMGRPAYAMPGYNSAGNIPTTPNSLPNQSVAARHDATSWMKEASISGSNDSGGSAYSDSYSGNDYGDSGDYGGGDSGGGAGDVGNGGGDGGSGPTGGGNDIGFSNCLPITGTDANGNPLSQQGTMTVTDSRIPSSHGGSPSDYLNVDSYGVGETSTGEIEDSVTSDMSSTSSGTNGNAGMDASSHGGTFNDYLSVDGYGVQSGNNNEGSNIGSTQSTTGASSNEYQNALDTTSRLLNKPQGTVSYDDVLGALTQIRGASQNPELTMREQQALNSVFMSVYTRGNTERVIGPTVTNEFLNAAITSMMFGGGMARMPKPNLSTGPMLPGTNSDFARYRPPGRETWQQSERDIGRWLGANNRGQVSYINGREVPHGTPGSVRPDFVSRDGIASFEVKNYNIATNMQALIQNVSSQAIDRARNLPLGMRQQIIIDVRGQSVSDAQRATIINGIVQQSNGAIQPEDILFIR